MANGTIAFDTLQTSGQITGTAKSVDTDYVVNGSAKSWVFITQSDATIESSFNVTSATDGGTGLTSITLTNAFSSANISGTFGHGNKTTSNPGQNLQAMCGTDASNTYGIEVERSDTSANADATAISLHLMGDLA